MQSLTIPDAHAAQMEPRTQLGQSARLGLRVRFLSLDYSLQLARQHRADAQALLCRKGTRPFQETLVDGQRDILFHRTNLHLFYA